MVMMVVMVTMVVIWVLVVEKFGGGLCHDVALYQIALGLSGILQYK